MIYIINVQCFKFMVFNVTYAVMQWMVLDFSTAL